MVIVGIACIIGLWAFVMGIIQQAIKKENTKTRYTLYIIATIIFVVYFSIMLAK